MHDYAATSRPAGDADLHVTTERWHQARSGMFTSSRSRQRLARLPMQRKQARCAAKPEIESDGQVPLAQHAT